jgi:hypothetical protein
VDKSGLLTDLVACSRSVFLSRPRRFGKSLMVDTLKELFEGNRPLFAGLAADTRWDWSQRHPVMRLSFGDGVVRNRAELDTRIHEVLRLNRELLGLTLPEDDGLARDIPGLFAHMIRQAQARHGQTVVVLIDEYDKPVLDHLDDPAMARELREGLKNLYTVLKDADPYLRFVLFTGVSKFSKVSLFSGLNQLHDITLEPRWSALCGYTDTDLDTVFAPELDGFDRDEIRRWYNGYHWRGTAVYNPFDVLLLFARREFRPYWFETGTPTFLVRLLAAQESFTPELAGMAADESLLTSFEVDHIEPAALLFQAGYLTIHATETDPETRDITYTLGYPNHEVAVSLNRVLLPAYGVRERVAFSSRRSMQQALRQADLPGVEAALRALYAGIPHDWYRNNPLARFEGHYASVFYSHLVGLGLDALVEDATSHGRIDCTVRLADRVYLFEFKVVEQEDHDDGQALAQLRARRYADKYRALGVPIHLVGVAFGRVARNLVGFEVELLGG